MVAINAAMGSEIGNKTLFINREGQGLNSLVIVSADTFSTSPIEIDVRVLTLDSMLSAEAIIDWLMIDVDGFELEVLRGGKNILGKTKRIIIEVGNQNRQTIEKLLSDHGFTMENVGNRTDYNEYWYLISNKLG